MKAPFHTQFIVDKNSLEALTSVRSALEGDVSLLISRIENGAVLSDQERDLLVKVLKKKPLRPPHRVPTQKSARQRETVAMFVYIRKHQMGGKLEAAVAEAETKFGVSRAYVMKALAEKRKDPEREQVFDGMMAFLASSENKGPNEDLPVRDVPLDIPQVTFTKSQRKSELL